jgi:hypothetical protein
LRRTTETLPLCYSYMCFKADTWLLDTDNDNESEVVKAKGKTGFINFLELALVKQDRIAQSVCAVE